MHIIQTLSLLALVSALGSATAPLYAQAVGGRGPATGPITLAVVDSMPVATAKALLVRKANGRTLLVLDRAQATPETLGLGLAAARHFAKQPTAGKERVIPIQGGVPITPISASRRAFLQRQLATVQSRKVGSLGSLGRGQFIEFTDELAGR
jgi:hypothetical protein